MKSFAKNFLKNSLSLFTDDLKGRVLKAEAGARCALRGQFHEPDTWLLSAKNSRRGERCFLLGCGPSLNDVNLKRLKGETIMGVNGTALIDDLELDYFVSVSNFFWKSHQDELRQLKCRRLLPHFLKNHLDSDCPTVWFNAISDPEYRLLDVEKPWKFSYFPEQYVFLGGTVIFVCLQFLYYLGFSEVVVLGLDHDYGLNNEKIPKSGKHFNSNELNAHFTKSYYRKGEQVHIDIHGMERAYALANEAYNKDARSILNASPNTKLDIFKKVDFDSCF